VSCLDWCHAKFAVLGWTGADCSPSPTSLRFAEGAGILAAPDAGAKVTMMRHGNRVKHLGRPADQRKALIRGLVTEVIRNGAIRTTKVGAASHWGQLCVRISAGLTSNRNGYQLLSRCSVSQQQWRPPRGAGVFAAAASGCCVG